MTYLSLMEGGGRCIIFSLFLLSILTLFCLSSSVSLSWSVSLSCFILATFILVLLVELIQTSLRFIRGRVDDLWFFEYLSSFCFLSIEFHCTFSISYKILPYFVYYYCILVRMWYAVGTSFIRARCTFFHTHASLLCVFVCLIYFILAVPMRKCLGKHSCMSNSFPIVILNDTSFFRQCNYKCTLRIQRDMVEIRTR